MRPACPVFLGRYCQQGRLAAAKSLIEAAWEPRRRRTGTDSEKAMVRLLLHLRLRLEPMPDEAIRMYLEQAARASRPTTIVSGWHGPTWRPATVNSMTPEDGSTPADNAVRGPTGLASLAQLGHGRR